MQINGVTLNFSFFDPDFEEGDGCFPSDPFPASGL